MQELTTMWSELAPVLHAVARWSEAPALKPGPIELPGIDPGGYVRALGTKFVDNRKTQKRRTLGDLVETVVPADPVVRVTTLKLAEHVIRAGFAH